MREAERRRRHILRAVRLAHTRKRCSSCKEKKPYVKPWKSVQLCQDCVARINARYGAA
jgi:hypothetical protein